MKSVWYVTADRAAVDWDTAVTGPAKDKQTNIVRLTRGELGDSNELSQVWARTGSRVGWWDLVRAMEEGSRDPVPAPLPAPSNGTTPAAPGGSVDLTAVNKAIATKLDADDVAKVARTGVETDLTRRPLTFNSRLPYPVVTRRPDLVVGTKAQVGLSSIYVPWIVKVPDAVAAAYPQYGKWRIYTSTDHDTGAGGIAIGISTADDPLDTSKWTWLRNAGSAKMFVQGSGDQVETPCVVFNPATNLWHMYYQAQSGSGSSVLQMTRLATSVDGVTNWTVVGNVLDNPSNTIAGYNHRGYARVYYIDGTWCAWHLQGNGTAVSAYGWSFSMDGINWVTDRRRVGAALQMTDGVLRLGISSLFHWRGDVWALISATDYVSGSTAAGTVRTGVAPINASDDYRSFRGRPQFYPSWSTLVGAETSVSGPPPSFVPLADGRLLGANRMNGENGSIVLAVLA
jgi:hypothetical protein